jgi:hypothetical protein
VKLKGRKHTDDESDLAKLKEAVMDFTIGILEVGQQYPDEDAKKFADLLEISDPQDIVRVFNIVKLAGTLYVQEKYHRKKRDLASDLLEVQSAKDSIMIAIQKNIGFSNVIQDDFNFIAALDRKDEAFGSIHRKDEMTAQFDIKNMLGESILYVPSSPKKTGEQSLYFVNDVGEILDTTMNQSKIDIDYLEARHRRLCKLENKYLVMLEGSKSRSSAEFFVIDVLTTFYEDITGKKGGRSNRPDKPGPDGRLLGFIEKALVRLRPPTSRHRRLDYALKKVLKFRKMRQEALAKIAANT